MVTVSKKEDKLSCLAPQLFVGFAIPTIIAYMLIQLTFCVCPEKRKKKKEENWKVTRVQCLNEISRCSIWREL